MITHYAVQDRATACGLDTASTVDVAVVALPDAVTCPACIMSMLVAAEPQMSALQIGALTARGLAGRDLVQSRSRVVTVSHGRRHTCGRWTVVVTVRGGRHRIRIMRRRGLLQVEEYFAEPATLLALRRGVGVWLIGEHGPPPLKPMTGDELRAIRRDVGLSQAELAARWGVRQETVSNWERSMLVGSLVAEAARRLSCSR